jgi:hypothetical protein
MNAIQEYALLFAVAAPLVTVVSMNLVLMLAGERGTLLLPELAALPTGTIEVRAVSAPTPAPAVVAANDEMAREAA